MQLDNQKQVIVCSTYDNNALFISCYDVQTRSQRKVYPFTSYKKGTPPAHTLQLCLALQQRVILQVAFANLAVHHRRLTLAAFLV